MHVYCVASTVYDVIWEVVVTFKLNYANVFCRFTIEANRICFIDNAIIDALVSNSL